MNALQTKTVKDIAMTHPDSYRIFHKYGIDFCCGGKRLLTDVCSEKGISVERVLQDIEAVSDRQETSIDWNEKSQQALIDHIIKDHHAYLRSELPRIQMLLDKVVSRHGTNNPHLIRVKDIFENMTRDLLQHIEMEEKVLFPMISRLEKNDLNPNIALPILMMETEHVKTGEDLEELKKLTDSYEIKNGMCGSYQALYTGLLNIDADIRLHIHKENNILFPRTMRSSQ